MHSKINIGDLFLIPFQNKYIIGKILHISKRTKKVFSFIMYNKIYDNKDMDLNNLCETMAEIKLYSGLTKVFYTSRDIFKDRNWEIIGNRLLNKKEETNLQYHNIGGNLYKGDEFIRALTEEELKSNIYSKRLIDGYDAIEIYLKIIFDINNNKKIK
jgi:hypothetical protein